MEIKISNINYKNDNGDVVSKEEFEREYSIFKKAVDDAYNQKAADIINKINNTCHSDSEKLGLLYDILTSDDMVYNLTGTTLDGRMALDYGYSFPPYKTWKVEQGTKYPVLLNKSGVCITYSLAFADLSNRLQIPCRVVFGNTGMEHAWNIVYINNEVKQIDVSYAIMNRKINNKKDYFLKDSFNGRTVTSSIPEAVKEMKAQYLNDHPQIKIISRTDNVDEEPKITIL